MVKQQNKQNSITGALYMQMLQLLFFFSARVNSVTFCRNCKYDAPVCFAFPCYQKSDTSVWKKNINFDKSNDLLDWFVTAKGQNGASETMSTGSPTPHLPPLRILIFTLNGSLCSPNIFSHPCCEPDRRLIYWNMAIANIMSAAS